MEKDDLERLKEHVRVSVGPVAAWPWRRRAMQEELQSHLTEAFAEEYRGGCDESEAMKRALQRLGDLNDLQGELQWSVPRTEQIFAGILFSKETPMMKRFLAGICLVTMFIWMVCIPEHAQVLAGVLGTLAVTRLLRVLQRKYGEGWWMRGYLPLLAGCCAFLFGTAMVLPALARIKRIVINGGNVPIIFLVGPLAVGAIIALVGLGIIAWRIRRRVMRIA